MRAYDNLKWALRNLLHRNMKGFLFYVPHVGKCLCCGKLSITTNERPAYSAYDGAYLCEPCAIDNDEETRRAWEDYYSGLL